MGQMYMTEILGNKEVELLGSKNLVCIPRDSVSGLEAFFLIKEKCICF